jgi:O-antigen ligase
MARERQRASLVVDDDADIADKWIFGALIGLLLWAPLPLGSNRTWALGILVVWVFALLAGVAYVWRHHSDAAWARLGKFAVPLTLLGAFVALVWAQTWVVPASWVEALSPESWRVERGVSPPRFSLDVHQNRLYAAVSSAYWAVFLVAVMTVRDKRRLELLAWGIVWAGLVQAVLGVVLFSTTAQYHIFFFEVIHDRVKGSFGYHNHFAGYMELCLSVGIGLMLARLGNDKTQRGNWRHRIARVLDFVLSEKMRLRLMLVVLVIALVLTRSRMGNTGFFAAMLIVGAVTLLLTRRSAPAMVALIVSLIVVDVFVIGTWVGLEKVMERVQGTTMNLEGQGVEESVELRQDAAKHGLDLVKAFPVFGTGGGSFYNSYIRYRTPRPGFFDHAHNDYVELAADYGLVGIGLLGALVLTTAWKCLRAIAKRRSSLPRGISFGVLMAMVALAIHSTVDFNLQLPANALTLVVILSMGWLASALPSTSSRE